MSSLFDSARGLLRASIADCFGYSINIITPQGDQRQIIGYIKHAKRGEHLVYRLITDERLPEDCATTHFGDDYVLVYDLPVKGTGTDSQISREYAMIQKSSSQRHDGWSEYANEK